VVVAAAASIRQPSQAGPVVSIQLGTVKVRSIWSSGSGRLLRTATNASPGAVPALPRTLTMLAATVRSDVEAAGSVVGAGLVADGAGGVVLTEVGAAGDGEAGGWSGDPLPRNTTMAIPGPPRSSATAAAMQPGLDGSLGDSAGLGHLGDAHIGDVMHDDRSSLVRGRVASASARAR
jgi:hypothetical protein